ncbi:MAG: M43 family zinc metalloprotease [Cytophagaceae bacterium]|nr:M43 family zinc metalloprotease [Cytophagaceae bacterium]MDW8456572.1 M43 family zinc metalloprotease [Cytophagaceae bacterium]
MKKFILIVIVLSVFSFPLCSQHRCAHTQYMQYLQKEKGWPEQKHSFEQAIQRMLSSHSWRTANSSENILYIPVVVHVIHNNSDNRIGGTNLPDEQILSQIDVLNEDYARLNADTVNTPAIFKPVAADTKIRFVLAKRDPAGNPTSGIVRVYTNKTTFSFSDDYFLKSLSYWPSDKYLNLWVANVYDASFGGTILGYAQFPSYTNLPGLFDDEGPKQTDGVVINSKVMGRIGNIISGFDKGRTATHEIGHWLGLRHIWGDDSCATDYVSDTPTQDSPTPSNYPCANIKYSDCGGSLPDMHQNYMDYSPDECMNLFTQGQADRMRAALLISPSRASTINSFGCCGGTDKYKIPFTESFEDYTFTSHPWRIVNGDSTNLTSLTWKKAPWGKNSNYCFSIKNEGIYTQGSPYYDFLETPFISLGGQYNVTFSFDLAYAKNNTSNNTDSLVLSYNLSCFDNWIPLKTFYANELITTSRRVNDFVPEQDEWKTVRIDISELRKNPLIKFRFENYSKGINNLYIDNLNVYKTSSSLEINPFPVPSDGLINLDIVFNDIQDVKIEIFDALGKLVLLKEFYNTTSLQPQINTNGWISGVYTVRVQAGKDVASKHISIINQW